MTSRLPRGRQERQHQSDVRWQGDSVIVGGQVHRLHQAALGGCRMIRSDHRSARVPSAPSVRRPPRVRLGPAPRRRQQAAGAFGVGSRGRSANPAKSVSPCSTRPHRRLFLGHAGPRRARAFINSRHRSKCLRVKPGPGGSPPRVAESPPDRQPCARRPPSAGERRSPRPTLKTRIAPQAAVPTADGTDRRPR